MTTPQKKILHFPDTARKSGCRVKSVFRAYLDGLNLDKEIVDSVADEMGKFYLKNYDRFKGVCRYKYTIPTNPFNNLTAEEREQISEVFASCVRDLILDFQFFFFGLMDQVMDIVVEKKIAEQARNKTGIK